MSWGRVLLTAFGLGLVEADLAAGFLDYSPTFSSSLSLKSAHRKAGFLDSMLMPGMFTYGIVRRSNTHLIDYVVNRH